MITGERHAVRALDGFAIKIHEVCVRAAKGNSKISLLERLREGDTVIHNLPLKRLELIRHRQLEGDRLPGHRINVRSALFSREDGSIEQPG